MKPLDVVILVAVGFAVIGSIVYIVRCHKKGKCVGCCGDCSKCRKNVKQEAKKKGT